MQSILASLREMSIAHLVDRAKTMGEGQQVTSATARNFARQDSNMVGVIVPEAHNPYFAAAVEGISGVLEESELLLILCNSNKNFKKEERKLHLLKQQKLKGLIITPSINDMDLKGTQRLYRNYISIQHSFFRIRTLSITY